MQPQPRIVVVGSLNVDYTLRVPRIPEPGETLTASLMLTCFGGKGANQAVAAARAGSSVSLIGCVGKDEAGRRYVEALQSEGIDTSGILSSDLPTGSAFIAVDDAGENTIIVNPGANHFMDDAHLESHAHLIRSADALLLQLECPLGVVRRAASIARAAGVPVILNPSPLLDAYLSEHIEADVLIVNEIEAARVSPGHDLRLASCSELIITRGGAPTLHVTAAGTTEHPPPQVQPVDTVGAGDAFAGAYAVALAMRMSEAIAFANAAGALATLSPGAQPSLPMRSQILEMARMPG